MRGITCTRPSHSTNDEFVLQRPPLFLERVLCALLRQAIFPLRDTKARTDEKLSKKASALE